jgi:hypothetical protein
VSSGVDFSGSVVSVPDRPLFCVLSVLVKVFAAFCAAETQDAKNPLLGVTFRDSDFAEGVLASSIVGVRGAERAFDSLLGWCSEAESERMRRWDIILPDGLTKIPLASFLAAEVSGARVGDFGVGARESTGVGGVTVVSGAFDPVPGGVVGRSLALSEGRLGLEIFGRSGGSVGVPAKVGEEARLVVCVCGRASSALTSAVSASAPSPCSGCRSGLVPGLLLDFPDCSAFLSFRVGEMPRIGLLMLFLRLGSNCEGGARVFARPGNVGEEREGVELVTGNEGECVMEGILDVLRAGLWTGSWEDRVDFSWSCAAGVPSSSAVVLISGDECVR